MQRVAPEAIVLFATTSARARDVEADLAAHLGSLLVRTPKSLQGQILFTVDGAAAPERVACNLLRLTQVDYVHVMLASCAVDGGAEAGGGLAAISRAAAAVRVDHFERAVDMWRAMVRLSPQLAEDPIVSAAAMLPTAELVFRARGKRGGKHDFSSDDAKRAAKRGLTSATGLSGSTQSHQLEVIAQVHCNRFWLGLRLNRAPLAPQPPPSGSSNAEAVAAPAVAAATATATAAAAVSITSITSAVAAAAATAKD